MSQIAADFDISIMTVQRGLMALYEDYPVFGHVVTSSYVLLFTFLSGKAQQIIKTAKNKNFAEFQLTG